MRVSSAILLLLSTVAASCMLDTKGMLRPVDAADPPDVEEEADPGHDEAPPDVEAEEAEAIEEDVPGDGTLDTLVTCPDLIMRTNDISIDFRCNQPVCTFECRLVDMAEWFACVPPQGFTGLSHGEITFEVRAKDSATGDVDTTPALCKWSIVPSSLTCGGMHTCLVTAGGGIKCWGNNASGQLGDGTTEVKRQPTDVLGFDSDVVAVSAGYVHTCAVTASGDAKCWGENFDGRLGDGSAIDSPLPVDVAITPGSVAAVSAGLNHGCAVKSTSGTKCWGQNDKGQLGSGDTVMSLSPIDVLGLSTGLVSIAAGGSRTCAVMDDGDLRCWGLNEQGELGIGTLWNSTEPVEVYPAGSGVVSVSAGLGSMTWALLDTGGVWFWSDDGTGTNYSSLPRLVPGMSSGVSMIAAGFAHGCAVMSATGAAWCWGWNRNGQLGNGTTVYPTGAVPVSELDLGVIEICAGGSGVDCSHSCAVTRAGSVKCWGCNLTGQLGNGLSSDSPIPVDAVGF
jgi:alpha-tubulin suppressor-like RCC1 family protein